MSTPQVIEEIICPECGAEVATTAARCWLCGRSLRADTLAVTPAPTHHERRAAYQFSITSIMLTITLAAVVLGVFRIQPGLGVVVAIIVTPAWLRTCINVARRKARAGPVSVPGKVAVFVSSVGIVIGFVIIGIAALLAAVAAACGLATLGGPDQEIAGIAFLVFLGSLAVIAVVVAIFVAAVRRARRRRQAASSPQGSA